MRVHPMDVNVLPSINKGSLLSFLYQIKCIVGDSCKFSNFQYSTAINIKCQNKDKFIFLERFLHSII